MASDWYKAEDILGKLFVSPAEVTSANGVSYTQEEVEYLKLTLPSPKALGRWNAHQIALLPAPPRALSMLDIRDLAPDRFYLRRGGRFFDESRAFSRGDKTSLGWLPIKVAPVEGSLGKTWHAQIVRIRTAPPLMEAPLDKGGHPIPLADDVCEAAHRGDERVPNAAEMAWLITVFNRVRNPLFGRQYVRTSSRDADGNRVIVGSAGVKFEVVYRGDDARDPIIGLASAPRLRILHF